MKKFFSAMLLASALVVAPAMAAPLVLTGNFIQVGISDYGTFGSNGNANPGFVHDPSGTGTFNPNFDYVAPGIPHDGFSLISDQFGYNQNTNAGISDLGFSSPSLLTGAAAMGFANAATWSGGNNFFTIVNSYFFNDGDERIIVKSTITALSDITNLAFARSVDPDSDNRAFGRADTNNQRGNSLFGINDFIACTHQYNKLFGFFYDFYSKIQPLHLLLGCLWVLSGLFLHSGLPIPSKQVSSPQPPRSSDVCR